ncbi:hypothetical protein MY3296_008370 [Beauveria thailandica]
MTTPSFANDLNADSESDATILNGVEAEDDNIANRRNSGLSAASYESDRRPASQPGSDFDESRRDSYTSLSGDRQSPVGSEKAPGRMSAGESSSQHEQDDDVFSDHSPRSSTGSNVDSDHLKQSLTASRRLTGGSKISDMQPFDPDEEFIPTVREAPRPPFRSPSSVKAMQLNSPPPSVTGSARSNRRATRSSVSRIGSPAVSAQFSPKKTPPRFKRSTPPLVLLHVTLLPLRWPWGDLMDNARPSELSDAGKNLREAWKQLQARVGDTLSDRGILLPHPQNDFEILEERLLEAMELPLQRRARILECGHYLGPANEMSMVDDGMTSDEEDFEERRTESGKRHWCSTCQSDIRYDSLGEGKVFRTKVYASNGLMKAGAWDACWKEMERVDVELEPILDPSNVDELERLAATQEREAIEAEIAASTHIERAATEDAFDAPPAHEDERQLYEERMREIYGQAESHDNVVEESETQIPGDQKESPQPWPSPAVTDLRNGLWSETFRYGLRDVVQLVVFILCVLLLQYLGIGFDRTGKDEPRESDNSIQVPATVSQEDFGTAITPKGSDFAHTIVSSPNSVHESYAACTSALEAAKASLALPVAASTVTVTKTVSVALEETHAAEVMPPVNEKLMSEAKDDHATEIPPPVDTSVEKADDQETKVKETKLKETGEKKAEVREVKEKKAEEGTEEKAAEGKEAQEKEAQEKEAQEKDAGEKEAQEKDAGGDEVEKEKEPEAAERELEEAKDENVNDGDAETGDEDLPPNADEKTEL